LDFHIDRRVVLNQDFEFGNLHKWSLQELDAEGKKIGLDQLPWSSSLYFTAKELALSDSLEIEPDHKSDDESKMAISEEQVIFAKLRPGDARRPLPYQETSYSMFGIGPLLSGTEHVAPFTCYRCPYGYPDLREQPHYEMCKITCANFVRYVLEKEGDVAAVIAEPARAVPYIPPPGYWAAVRKACNDTGALLIFDEIPTGLGKTGRMFACEHDDVTPDILVMGKGLGGGIMPIGATLARPVLDVAGDFAIGHYTHEKSPVATRAALTTIEIIEDEGLVENAAVLGSEALDRLREMEHRHGVIGETRGRGFLMGIELVKNKDEKEAAYDLAEDVYYRCLDAGLSFKVTMGNNLTLTPPLILTREQMDFALGVIDGAIGEAARTHGLA